MSFTLHNKLRFKSTVVSVHVMWAYWENKNIAPLILNVGSSRRWVVSFTPRPLYPREENICTQRIAGCIVVRANLDDLQKENLSSLSGFEPWIIKPHKK